MNKKIAVVVDIEVNTNETQCSKACPFMLESTRRKTGKCILFAVRGVKLESAGDEFQRCEKCMAG